jgi:hypothetical protein
MKKGSINLKSEAKDDGSMRRYEKDAKDNSRHLTTIVGPQAECIRESLRNGLDHTWCDKTVDGLCVLELWIDKPSTDYWYE